MFAFPSSLMAINHKFCNHVLSNFHGPYYLGTIHKRRLPNAKGEGGGLQKMPKKEMFTSRFEETREGGYPKNLKFGETSFMDGP